MNGDKQNEPARVGNRLQQRLHNPAVEDSIIALAENWFSQRVWVEVAGHTKFDNDLEVLNRLRGALGDQMKNGASDAALNRQPCTWASPCALHVFYGQHGVAAGKQQIATPYHLRVQRVGENLRLSVEIAGFACDYLEAIGEALVAAVRLGNVFGRNWSLDPQVLNRGITSFDGGLSPGPEDAGTQLGLEFLTPLANRGGKSVRDDPFVMLELMFKRCIAIAPWLDQSVRDQPSILFDDRDRLEIIADRNSGEARRFGSAEGYNKHRYQVGYSQLTLAGSFWSPTALAALAICTQVGIGPRTSFGYGTFFVQ